MTVLLCAEIPDLVPSRPPSSSLGTVECNPIPELRHEVFRIGARKSVIARPDAPQGVHFRRQGRWTWNCYPECERSTSSVLLRFACRSSVPSLVISNNARTFHQLSRLLSFGTRPRLRRDLPRSEEVHYLERTLVGWVVAADDPIH